MAMLYRTDDAMLTLCQNNDGRSIEIADANEAASALLGYRPGELSGDLKQFMPANLAGDIDDYVEYETGGNDVGTVLARMKEFKLLQRNGTPVPLVVKAVRSAAPDHNDWFRVFIKPEGRQSEKEKLLGLLHEHFKSQEVNEGDIGLPDRESLLRNADLVAQHTKAGTFNAAAVVITLDRYNHWRERYSRSFCVKALRMIADICRQNLRVYDVIGALDDTALGLLLLDIAPESANPVLNRLRWSLSSRLNSMIGLSEEELTISVSYRIITDSGKETFENSEQALGEHARSGVTNALLHPPETSPPRAALP